MKNIFHHKFLSIVTSAIILISLGTGCNRNCNPATVNLNISLAWEGVPVSIGDTVLYSTDMPLRLEKFRCYINDISLRNLDGVWLSSESIDIIEFIPSSDIASGKFEAEWLKQSNEFDAIRFGLGVYPEINAIDNAPSTFPNASPLSVAGSAGMYWTWETGYIFSKYEGKIAQAQGEEFTIPFAFHTGTDELYREVILEFSGVEAVCEEEIIDFNIALDLSKAINGTEDNIDLVADGITHTLDNLELAERFVNLFDDAWSISE